MLNQVLDLSTELRVSTLDLRLIVSNRLVKRGYSEIQAKDFAEKATNQFTDEIKNPGYLKRIIIDRVENIADSYKNR